MTRARSLSRLANTNAFTVDASQRVGIGSTQPDVRLDVDGDMNVSGTLTYEDVTNVETAGITTTGGLVVTGLGATIGGITTFFGDINFGAAGVGGTVTTLGHAEFAGIVTASSFRGDGSQLSGVDSSNLVDSGDTNRVAANTSGIVVTGIATVTSDVSIADKIIHTGDTNTAIRFPAVDTFTVETAGSERVRITSAGLVGINTDNPGCLLTVNGNSASANSTGGTLLVKQKGDTSDDGLVITSSNANSGRIFKDSDGRLIIYNRGTTGGIDQLVLSNSGEGAVGINSLSPTETFDIDSAGTPTTMKIRSTTQSSILFDDIGGSPKQYRIGTNINGNNGQFEIYDDTSDESRLVVGTAGSFGLNNTNPLEVLHVKFTSTNSSTRTSAGNQVTDCGLKIENEANADNNYCGLLMRAGNADVKLFTERSSSDNANFRIAVDDDGTLTERFRIKGNDGKIGVSNSDPIEAFHIKYDTNSSSTRTNTGGGHVGCGLKVENTNSTTNSYAGIFLRSNDADIKINCVRPAANRADLELIMDNGTTGTKYLTIEGADGDVLPGGDNEQDLGSASLRWANIYSADLQLSNEGMGNDVDGTWGQYTIQEGEDDLFLLNRRNGKTYKFVLQEVN